MVEPEPDWVESLRWTGLRSTIDGVIDRGSGDITFIKKYTEAERGVDWSLDYSGKLKPDEITGQFKLDGGGGPFYMVRET